MADRCSGECAYVNPHVGSPCGMSCIHDEGHTTPATHGCGQHVLGEDPGAHDHDNDPMQHSGSGSGGSSGGGSGSGSGGGSGSGSGGGSGY